MQSIGILFRLGEQVSYLLVCANKDGVLRLDQSKMISAKNHLPIFDFFGYKNTGDRFWVNLIRSLLAIFWFKFIDNESFASLKRTISAMIDIKL